MVAALIHGLAGKAGGHHRLPDSLKRKRSEIGGVQGRVEVQQRGQGQAYPRDLLSRPAVRPGVVRFGMGHVGSGQARNSAGVRRCGCGVGTEHGAGVEVAGDLFGDAAVGRGVPGAGGPKGDGAAGHLTRQTDGPPPAFPVSVNRTWHVGFRGHVGQASTVVRYAGYYKPFFGGVKGKKNRP